MPAKKKPKRPMAGFSKRVFDSDDSDDGAGTAVKCDQCGKSSCFCARQMTSSTDLKGDDGLKLKGDDDQAQKVENGPQDGDRKRKTEKKEKKKKKSKRERGEE